MVHDEDTILDGVEIQSAGNHLAKCIEGDAGYVSVAVNNRECLIAVNC